MGDAGKMNIVVHAKLVEFHDLFLSKIYVNLDGYFILEIDNRRWLKITEK